LLGEDIRLTVDTGDRPVYLRADPTQLEQVIMNLVVNARDAMPKGGNLNIEISRAHFDAEGLAVAWKPKMKTATAFPQWPQPLMAFLT